MNSSKNLIPRISKPVNIFNYEKILISDIIVIKRKKILFVNYYVDDKRKDEFDICLKNNINNTLINEIYIITHERITKQFKEQISKKVKFIKIKNDRPTYDDIFEIMNKVIKEDEIGIFANLDIYFDETLSLIDTIHWDVDYDICLALTRWDVDMGGVPGVKHHGRVDSQDVWIFKGEIKVIGGDFSIGKPGCDNRIAHEIGKSGYELLNPSLSIKCYHLHNSGMRNYSDVDKVPSPYRLVPFTKLLEKDEIIKVLSLSSVKHEGKMILYFALGTHQTCLKDALSTLGLFHEFHWRKYNDIYGEKDTRNRMIELVAFYKPDLLFMQIQTPNIIDSKLIKIFNELNPDGKIINWSGDARQPTPEWYLDVGKEENVITCFSNNTDVQLLKSKGIKSELLQIGYEHKVYNRDGSIKKEIPKIVFFGNHYGSNIFPLSKFRLEVVEYLNKTYGNRFQVFGYGWPGNLHAIDYNTKPHKEAEVYRSCKIAVAMNHFNLSRYVSDRVFRVMGSGAFNLMLKYKDCEKDFKDKKHVVYWNDLKDLSEKINYYLVNDTERIEIAKNGNKLAEEKYRWVNHINDLKVIMGW